MASACGSPQVDHLTVELYVHLVDVPFPLPEAPHPRDALPANVSCEHRPETVPPMPHRLVADVDAALEQQIFHVPQRHREANVHHDHEADHLRR
jgi:hypothetical protein